MAGLVRTPEDVADQHPAARQATHGRAAEHPDRQLRLIDDAPGPEGGQATVFKAAAPVGQGRPRDTEEAQH